MAMQFDAVIEKNGKKLFEQKGESSVEEILSELDRVVKKEIDSEKK